MEIMPIDNIPDWEMRLARQDAFWDRAIIDRPVINIVGPNPEPVPAPDKREYPSIRERWMDTEGLVANALHMVKSAKYYGDALPQAWPNLGPEIFSAFLGCELEYSKETSWAIPNLHDWSDTSHIRFSEDNFYWKKINEMTDALLEAGKGIFYTGITDIHPGADAIAAFRDPLELNYDMIDSKEQILQMLEKVNSWFFDIFDFYYDNLRSHKQAICNWMGIVSSRKWYGPSNDFSCMISKKMFDEVFLPGLVEECRFLEASIYHLDGPGALTHLDSLLEIEELDAIQWVHGAGNGRSSDWLHIYKKCQAAGKGLQIYIEPDEMDTIVSELKPEGVWLGAWVSDEDTAEILIKKAEAWT